MSDFSAALIAGGRSRRMGTDKAFLDWKGRPLWEHQMEKLRELHPEQLLLSCRSDQPFPAQPDITPVYDAWPDCGPLGGVASCLRASSKPLLAVLGIDLPLLAVEFLRRLLASCTNGNGAVIVRGGAGETYHEPLAAVYPAVMRSLAEEQIAAGRLSMQEFIRRGLENGWLREMIAPVEAAEWFTNLNAPDDLNAAQRGAANG